MLSRDVFPKGYAREGGEKGRLLMKLSGDTEFCYLLFEHVTKQYYVPVTNVYISQSAFHDP